MKKPKRTIYWLRLRWAYGHAWLLTRGKENVFVPLGAENERTLAQAKKVSRTHCRNRWKKHGEPCQLRICNQKGRVSEENTYGRDPREYRG